MIAWEMIIQGYGAPRQWKACFDLCSLQKHNRDPNSLTKTTDYESPAFIVIDEQNQRIQNAPEELRSLRNAKEIIAAFSSLPR